MFTDASGTGGRILVTMRKMGLLAAIALVLAGCGSNSSLTATEDSPSPTASSTPADPSPSADPTTAATKPATGVKLSSGPFSMRVPKGWADTTERADQGVALTAANLGEDDNRSMLTVKRIATPPADVAAAEAAATAELKSFGARRITVDADPAEVGGFPVAHVRGVKNAHGLHQRLDLYYVLAGKDAWIIDIATNQWQVARSRTRLLESMLATCTWA
jgi:hypothetical protein